VRISGRTVDLSVLKVLTAGAVLFFIAFEVARAARVPLTYDEAATYLRYISAGFLSVFKFDVATNHFLNTLLTKLFYVAGGDSELVLRMPNLIGYGMYLAFSLLILRAVGHRTIAFAGFMLLNLNPYVLDYFSLSRGYGLSLGFLMGAIFFLLKFLTRLRTGTAGNRELSMALVFGCAAVISNFSLLNVYMGLFAVALIALVVVKSRTRAQPVPNAAVRRRLAFPWLPVAATLFSLLVLSQDIGLSEAIYEPVEVRLAGLNEAELDAAVVSRVDVRGRATGLPFDSAAMVWRTDPRVHVAGLRIELPAAAASKVTFIDVTVGSRRFRRDSDHAEGWTSTEAGSTRVLESSPSLSLPRSRLPAYRSMLNWGGDGRYAAYLAGYTALGLFILGALALLLNAVGRLAARAGLLDVDQWRPLASGALWVAALVGWPLYILRRESELYFGGNQGLVEDTFYSLVGGSFYDRAYHPAQNQILFVSIVVTVVAFLVALYQGYRRRKLASVLPAASLLTILVIASAASLVERWLFQTPYPLGRTALFYIPLYVLFVTFSCETIADLGRTGRIAAATTLAVMLSCSSYHFATSANLTFALDWWRDSRTKAMMEDLEQVVAAERPPGSRVVLGVDRGYSAVAAFYAGKHKAANINIVVVPTPSDYVYVEDRNQIRAGNVIRRYPVAGGVLARP